MITAFDLTQPWQTARFAAMDLATTGRDAENDRIIEIGVAVFEGGEVVHRWQQLVNPECLIPDEVVAITGIENKDVADAPVFADVVDVFVSKLSGLPMLAYNATFDIGFLQAELRRLGRSTDLPASIDPFPFCWEYLREAKLTANAKLSTVCEYFNVPLEAAHRADHDAEAAGRVLYELLQLASLPESIGDLLQLQGALAQKLQERFNRFKRDRGTARSVLSGGELAIELGAAYLYGDESDPIRALFQRIPDVRDL